MQVKLTYDPTRTLKSYKFKDGLSMDKMIDKMRDDWVKVHALVDSEQSRLNKYAMAFAEVYAPEYDDDQSGAMTIALDAVIGKSPKAIVAKPVNEPKAAKVAKVAPKAKATKQKPATKAKAKGKVSKADKVRAVIAENKSEGVEAVIKMVVGELEMTLSQAKTYVKGNWDKVAQNEDAN